MDASQTAPNMGAIADRRKDADMQDRIKGMGKQIGSLRKVLAKKPEKPNAKGGSETPKLGPQRNKKTGAFMKGSLYKPGDKYRYPDGKVYQADKNGSLRRIT